MDKEILQKYISNPERNENTPDEITFGDEKYDFMLKNTYPFSYVQMPGTKEYQLLFGEPGTTHARIRDRIVNAYRKEYNNFTTLDRLFGGYMRKEYVEQMKRPKANAEECIERAIKFGGREYLENHEQNGRCFFISKDDTNICIFSFWNVYRFGDDDEDYLEPDSQDIGRLVKMVMEKDQRIGQCDLILIANNSEPYYVYKEDVPDDFFKIGDNTDRFIPHLADQDKKREFFADFRTTRDNKIAKKLTSPETGKEMPLAQYNALRYVDESIEHSNIPEELTNPGWRNNTPDFISLGRGYGQNYTSEVYSWKADNAIPFTYLTFNNVNKLFIGKPGESHHNLKMNKVREFFDENLGDMAWSIYYSLISQSGRNIMKSGNIDGRVWTNIKLKSTPNKTFSIFAFWFTDEEMISKLVEMVANKLGITNTEIYIANSVDPYIPFNIGGDIEPEIRDNSQAYLPHLADQQKKHEFFADFRATKNKKIADKLTNPETGREMPLAQWNALKYVDESKIGPRRIFVTESQLNEYLKEGNKKQYSWNDKLELVRDKNIIDGGNFPIKRNGKEYWISRSTTVGVYVFCLDQTGVIYTLASKRGPHVHTQQNLWNAPCGYLEYGDSIKETAVKECWEETGVKIPFEKLVYLGENSEFSRNSDVKHTFYCVLDGLITDYPPSIANCEPGEVTDARWIELDELDKYHFVGQQAKKLYKIGFKLFKRVGLYKTNKDYATIIQSLQNMLSSGIIDDEQIARIKDVLNL